MMCLKGIIVTLAFVYLAGYGNGEGSTVVPDNFTALITEADTTEPTCNSNETCTTNGEYLSTTALPKNESKTNKTKKVQTKHKIRSRKFIPVGNKQICSCNTLRSFCDINCCCDLDCSQEQKFVFSSCEKQEIQNYDRNYCKYLEAGYENYTWNEWFIHQNSLFCIERSNLPKQYVVEREIIIDSIPVAKKFMEGKYSWPIKNKILNTTIISYNRIAYGQPLWIARNFILEKFSLPTSFVTNDCTKMKFVRYLEDHKSKCIQRIINNKNSALDAKFYLSAIFVVKQDLYTLKNCSADVCVKPSVKVCEDFYKCYEKKEIPDLVCQSGRNVCNFAVQKVQYKIYHNGTFGIKQVDVSVTLKNISYGSMLQEFEVKFYWHNFTENNYSLYISGNPGYLPGKYVLTGKLNLTKNVKNETHQNVTVIRPTNVFRENFLIFPKAVDGFCKLDDVNFEPFLFAYNTKTKCRLNYTFKTTNLSSTLLCQNFQKLVLKMWSLDYNQLRKAVAVFGNSSVSDVDDWLSIIFDTKLENLVSKPIGNFSSDKNKLYCNNLSTKLIVHIFHRRVYFGSNEDQEKIVGVFFTFELSELITFTIAKNYVTFDSALQSEVAFFDVTPVKEKIFADPPSLSFKLPYDFFYPFVKIDNSGNVFSSQIWICTLFNIFVIIFNLI